MALVTDRHRAQQLRTLLRELCYRVRVNDEWHHTKVTYEAALVTALVEVTVFVEVAAFELSVNSVSKYKHCA